MSSMFFKEFGREVIYLPGITVLQIFPVLGWCAFQIQLEEFIKVADVVKSNGSCDF